VTAPGVILSITTLSPLQQLYGAIDVEVIFAGTHLGERVCLYIDEELQGDQMTFVRRNRWVQGIDTAMFLDGAHRITVAAFESRGQVLASACTDVFFRNLMSFNFISVRPNDDNTGFVTFLKINTLRTPMPSDSFVAVDRWADEREKLECTVSYDGSLWNGTPIARLEMKRPGGQQLDFGVHRLRLTIQDNQGGPATFADHKLFVGLTGG
jgi:hypothetical protein